MDGLELGLGGAVQGGFDDNLAFNDSKCLLLHFSYATTRDQDLCRCPARRVWRWSRQPRPSSCTDKLDLVAIIWPCRVQESLNKHVRHSYLDVGGHRKVQSSQHLEAVGKFDYQSGGIV